MPRADLDLHFHKVDELVVEIQSLVPSTSYRAVQFRADLAGLLVVAIAATYETCVKEVMFEYSSRHNSAFGEFTQRQYERLNSRINVRDLKRYCETFNPNVCAKFKHLLSERKRRILSRTGKNIENSYEQILAWRHDFAHARIRRTTIEEASATHLFGKRVLYTFSDAFLI